MIFLSQRNHFSWALFLQRMRPIPSSAGCTTCQDGVSTQSDFTWAPQFPFTTRCVFKKEERCFWEDIYPLVWDVPMTEGQGGQPVWILWSTNFELAKLDEMNCIASEQFQVWVCSLVGGNLCSCFHQGDYEFIWFSVYNWMWCVPLKPGSTLVLACCSAWLKVWLEQWSGACRGVWHLKPQTRGITFKLHIGISLDFQFNNRESKSLLKKGEMCGCFSIWLSYGWNLTLSKQETAEDKQYERLLMSGKAQL